MELLGKEQVEGSAAYKLQVTLESGAVRTMYIDAEHSSPTCLRRVIGLVPGL